METRWENHIDIDCYSERKMLAIEYMGVEENNVMGNLKS